jgi:hypothetical protein
VWPMSYELVDRLLRAKRIRLPHEAFGARTFQLEVGLLIDRTGNRLSIGSPFEGNDDRTWGVFERAELGSARLSHFEWEVTSVEVSLRGVTHHDGSTVPSISRLIFHCEHAKVVIHPTVDGFCVPCVTATIFNRFDEAP